MRDKEKSPPDKPKHMTIRDTDYSLRQDLDDLCAGTKDDNGLAVDRSTMVRILVDEEKARRKKRR